MRASKRPGASTYIEVFVLVGIVIGGSGIVLDAALGYTRTMSGPAVTIVGASVRQGAYLASEELAIINSGDGSAASFALVTTGVAPSALYCYSLYNLGTKSLLFSSCPATSQNPGSVPVSYALAPGQSVLVEITVMGEAFTVGSSCQVTVTASSGAQQSVGVQVAPA